MLKAVMYDNILCNSINFIDFNLQPCVKYMALIYKKVIRIYIVWPTYRNYERLLSVVGYKSILLSHVTHVAVRFIEFVFKVIEAR